MRTRVTRRDALAQLCAVMAIPVSQTAWAATMEENRLALGDPQPFSFDRLKAQAAALAQKPWSDPRSPYSDILQKIDYDAFNKIRFRRDHALWAATRTANPVQLFHLGRYFQQPTTISVVENGEARQVHYRKAYFQFPRRHVAHDLPEDIGFSGFRVMGEDQSWDWLAFLGASYFRSPGTGKQYGLSARGLAIDTAMPTPEEFPRFTDFWLEPYPGEREKLVVYALLDSLSVTGAYRFDCVRKGGVLMDVELELYPRKPIQRLGVAPLTAMFWYGEKERTRAIDWRPEIHDSDGLSIWTGAGERIWRPLNNPPRVMTNSFADLSPRGFGLLQRDRNFDHYQDTGVFYHRRPSLWVEPIGDWGAGAVQLVEIPTDDEIHDNIVAYWVPEAAVLPGKPLAFSYRLHWRNNEPFPADTGTVTDTYAGIGGIPGQERLKDVYKFVVDFAGGKLASFDEEDDVLPAISVSRGRIGPNGAHPIIGRPGHFRAVFDLEVRGKDPVDLRLFLRKGGEALSETWLLQFFPESPESMTVSTQ
jgi:glucans biosynthesis protein